MNQISAIRAKRALAESDLTRITGLSQRALFEDRPARSLRAGELNTVAETLGVPPFALLQSSTPEVSKLPRDYRTEGNRSALQTKYSLAAIYKTYSAADAIDALADKVYFDRTDLPQLDPKTTNAETAADEVANLLRINGDDLAEFDDPIDAFYLLRYQIERLGIFFFSERIIDKSIRGYCVQTKRNRYIVTNALRHSYRSRLFTATHELAHFLFSSPGIVDPMTGRLPLERLCNSIAAEYLVPGGSLKRLLSASPRRTFDNPTALVDWLHEQLPFSKYFIAIRVQELGGEYEGFVRRWLRLVGVGNAPGPTSAIDLADFNVSVDQLDSEDADDDTEPVIRRLTPASYHSARLGFNALSLVNTAERQNLVSRFDIQFGLELPAKSFAKTYESYQKRLKEVRKHAPE